MGTLVLTLLCGSILYFGVIHQASYLYRIPEQIDDGWITASVNDVGINETLINTFMNALSTLEDHPLHSMLIVKDGKLVFEEYFSGEDIEVFEEIRFVHKEFDRTTLHCLASVSKSITSLLVGIAADHDDFDIQDTIFSVFPEYADLIDSEKAQITFHHFLTMSSGIPWDESFPYTDPRNDIGYMLFQSSDPIGYVLEKSTVAEPGSVFIYNSGTTNLLGEAVRRKTGVSLVEFANQYLFTPLEITSYNWGTFPKAPQIAVASSLLYLRPRDMAKIGQLYVQKGMWNGTRIVSEQWIEDSTNPSINVPHTDNPLPELVNDYGYQWWRGTFSHGNIDTYFAAGWGGQFIFIFPDITMVIVVTAGNFGGENTGFYEMINNYILAALNGSK
jgi:CubicO group peptidase (beta-lactamase class C family)